MKFKQLLNVFFMISFFSITFGQIELKKIKVADVLIEFEINDSNTLDIVKGTILSSENITIGNNRIMIPYSQFFALRDSLDSFEYQIIDPNTGTPFLVNRYTIDHDENRTTNNRGWVNASIIQGNSEEWHDGNWDEGTSPSSYNGPGTIPYYSWGAVGLDSYNSWGNGMWISYSMNPNASDIEFDFKCMSNEFGTGQYVEIYLRNFSTWEWVLMGTITDKNNQEWTLDPSTVAPYVDSDGRCDFIVGSNDGYVFDWIEFWYYIDPPNAPSWVNASDVYCNLIYITWGDNSSNETGFKVYRNGTLIATKSANSTSHYDYSATPGVTYNYCVSAYNDGGESNQVCDNGYQAPTPNDPSNVSATDGTYCEKVRITWSDNSNNETGFKVYRGSTLIATKPANSTSHDDTGGSPGVTYTYKVYAYNDCGNSGYDSDNGNRASTPNDPSNVSATALCA